MAVEWEKSSSCLSWKKCWILSSGCSNTTKKPEPFGSTRSALRMTSCILSLVINYSEIPTFSLNKKDVIVQSTIRRCITFQNKKFQLSFNNFNYLTRKLSLVYLPSILCIYLLCFEWLYWCLLLPIIKCIILSGSVNFTGSLSWLWRVEPPWPVKFLTHLFGHQTLPHS